MYPLTQIVRRCEKERKKKERKKEIEKEKRLNGIVQVGGMGRGFCRGGVFANLDFCDVGLWGGERGGR